MSMNFKNILKSYCMQSSVLGLKYFYLYPDRISRCYWTITMIALLGVASILTTLLWNRFRDMPTRITIEDEYSSVLELPYPAITLCTPNQMYMPNVKHFRRTLVDGNVTEEDMNNLNILLSFYEPVSKPGPGVLNRLNELININRHNVREVMTELPQKCDQFLKHCIFEAEVVNCKDYFKPMLTAHGLCCIFNSPYSSGDSMVIFDRKFEPIRPKTPGMFGGLTVLTDYDPNHAMNGTLLKAGAVRVMVNDWTEFPSDGETALVSPHVESFHSINAIRTYCSEDVMSLNIESRKCAFYDEHPLEHFPIYRNSDCGLECFMHELWKTCRCVPFFLPSARVSHVCTVNKIECIWETKVNLTRNTSKAKCHCPRDCNSRRYKVHMTIANFKANEFLIFDFLYKNLVPSETSTLMHFYFQNAFYMKQKQETVMSLINLTSNLGGVFGMCLGCSVMSIIEIVIFILTAIRNTRKRAIEQRRTKHNVKKPRRNQTDTKF